MTLSPAMLERIRQGWGDVPEIRLLLDENERLREEIGTTSTRLHFARLQSRFPDPIADSLIESAHEGLRAALGEPKP